MTQTDNGRLAVITGASGGVAPAVARRFARAGYRLALVTRPGKEKQALALLGSELAEATSAPPGSVPVAAYGADLTAAAETREAFAAIEAEQGEVDALVNLAGGFAMGKASEVDAERFERMIDINLRTAVNATLTLLSGMLARQRGFVAALAANAVLSPSPGMTAYAASKGAVATYFRSLAAEVAPQGVNVALLLPSTAIDTPSNRAAMPNTDPANWVDPDALADALLFLATRPVGGRVHEMVVSPR